MRLVSLTPAITLSLLGFWLQVGDFNFAFCGAVFEVSPLIEMANAFFNQPVLGVIRINTKHRR